MGDGEAGHESDLDGSDDMDEEENSQGGDDKEVDGNLFS